MKSCIFKFYTLQYVPFYGILKKTNGGLQMGITVGYLLSQDFFRDFQVVAGFGGMNRDIQGVTAWDAPDGAKWTLGKELVFTNGYSIAHEKQGFSYLTPESIRTNAGLIIKKGRYLETIPPELLELYDRENVPVITMPYSISWMELINQINVAVMNHAITQLCVNLNTKYTTCNQNYKTQKIQQLLYTVEKEMSFPAAIYDVFENKTYFSSQNFVSTSEKYGLHAADYCDPQLPHTRHTLCDCIHMCRYRLINGEAPNEPRISWVTIPILVDGVAQAYFYVMESRRFMDFYDEYFMRIAFMVLRGIYEQIAVARDVSNIGFESLVHLAMDGSDDSYHKLVDQAEQLGISLDHPCFYILFRHEAEEFDLRSRRNELIELFHHSAADRYGRLAFLSPEEGILVIDSTKLPTVDQSALVPLIEEFHTRLVHRFPGSEWTFSYTMEQTELTHLRDTVRKCRKIMQIGRVACPSVRILDYDRVGVLTWLDIPEDELRLLLEPLNQLRQEGKNKDLLQTLRVYLECNMNYSLTAERLYVNINTVRRRIEKINELISIDWDNYMERIKIGLLVQFLQ